MAVQQAGTGGYTGGVAGGGASSTDGSQSLQDYVNGIQQSASNSIPAFTPTATDAPDILAQYERDQSNQAFDYINATLPSLQAENNASLNQEVLPFVTDTIGEVQNARRFNEGNGLEWQNLDNYAKLLQDIVTTGGYSKQDLEGANQNGTGLLNDVLYGNSIPISGGASLTPGARLETHAGESFGQGGTDPNAGLFSNIKSDQDSIDAWQKYIVDTTRHGPDLAGVIISDVLMAILAAGTGGAFAAEMGPTLGGAFAGEITGGPEGAATGAAGGAIGSGNLGTAGTAAANAGLGAASSEISGGNPLTGAIKGGLSSLGGSLTSTDGTSGTNATQGGITSGIANTLGLTQDQLDETLKIAKGVETVGSAALPPILNALNTPSSDMLNSVTSSADSSLPAIPTPTFTPSEAGDAITPDDVFNPSASTYKSPKLNSATLGGGLGGQSYGSLLQQMGEPLA